MGSPDLLLAGYENVNYTAWWSGIKIQAKADKIHVHITGIFI